MHFNIERTKLQTNIQHLISVVPVKTITPILTNFLLEADIDKQEIIVTATDMEVTIIVRIQTTVLEEGKLAVSARNLLEIINSVDDKPVDFKTEDGYLKIHCHHANFKLFCADHSQFPAKPEFSFDGAYVTSAPVFAKMIRIAGVAVSHEETRPIFTGLLWRITPEMQIIAATDGKRISEVRKAYKIEIPDKMESVIPIKGLSFLEKVITENSPEIRYIIESNRVIFSYMNYTVSSQTIAGRYPEYSKALQAENPHSLIMDKDILRQAVKRVALLATDEYFKIKFKITGSEIVISSFDNEMGDAKEAITDFEYSGPDFEIAFNYKFVLSILSVIETEKVKITFAEPVEGMVNNQALIYNYPDLDNYKVLILLMPLRLKT